MIRWSHQNDVYYNDSRLKQIKLLLNYLYNLCIYINITLSKS